LNINESKQNRFNSKWYCEYPLLEYSVITNAAYCFACTLFPKGNGRQSSYLAWTSKGVNQWHITLNVYMSEIENTLRLRNLSKTRWTARAESIKAVWCSLEAISKCLQELHLSNNVFDRNTRTKALGLRKKFFHLISWCHCLS